MFLLKLKNYYKKKKINITNSKILILGYTFKENCSDVRNSRSIELSKKFKNVAKSTFVYDPVASSKIDRKNKIKSLSTIKGKFDLIIVAVGHNKFKDYSKNFFKKHLKKKSVFVDLNRLYKGSIKSDFSL